MTHQPHASHDCRALLAQISDYIDGDLEAELCAELEKHLSGCDNCRVMVDTTRKTVRLYQRNYQRDPVSLPQETTDRLWQAIKAAGCISDDNG